MRHVITRYHRRPKLKNSPPPSIQSEIRGTFKMAVLADSSVLCGLFCSRSSL